MVSITVILRTFQSVVVLLSPTFLQRQAQGTHWGGQGGCGGDLTSDAFQVHDFELVEFNLCGMVKQLVLGDRSLVVKD